MQTIIFTDLDGTLLNHDDYRFDDAKAALAALRKQHIPVVIVSSKTAAEIALLQTQLDLRDPFISENGAAIHLPETFPLDPSTPTQTLLPGFKSVVLGYDYARLRRFCSEHPELGMLGFGDMGTETVAELTGLTHEKAALAARRDHTEPFILKDGADLAAVIRAAEAQGLSVTRGGRFYHLKRAHTDKGAAIRKFLSLLDRKTRTIALGDSENDREMLELADLPLVVRKPDGSCLDGFVRCSSRPGAAGWNELVLGVLNNE